LSVEPSQSYITIQIPPELRWKLPAEPEKILPTVCASFEKLQQIVILLAAASNSKSTEEISRHLAKAEATARSAAILINTTQNSSDKQSRPQRECCRNIIIPRWLESTWPAPPNGDNLGESFISLAERIGEARFNLSKALPNLLQLLDGFWEQLVLVQSASLQTRNGGWSASTADQLFPDSPWPRSASKLYKKKLDGQVDYYTDEQLFWENLNPSLHFTDEDLTLFAKIVKEYSEAKK